MRAEILLIRDPVIPNMISLMREMRVMLVNGSPSIPAFYQRNKQNIALSFIAEITLR